MYRYPPHTDGYSLCYTKDMFFSKQQKVKYKNHFITTDDLNHCLYEYDRKVKQTMLLAVPDSKHETVESALADIKSTLVRSVLEKEKTLQELQEYSEV